MMEETRHKKLLNNQPEVDEKGPRSCCYPLLQTIEKICSKPSIGCKEMKNDVAEDFLQLRLATAKLLLLTTSNKFDNCSKEYFVRKNGFPLLIKALLTAQSERHVVQNIIGILLELLHKPTDPLYLTILVNCDACGILLQILATEIKEIVVKESLIIQLHQLLAKIGAKDPRFPVKARFTQSIGVTMNLIKTNTMHFKNLLPLLRVLKMYSTNGINASYLVKNGCIQVMTRIISNCYKTHHTIIKNALGILCNVTKSKAGKAVFIAEDGIKIMYSTVREGINMGDTESLVIISSSILRKCCPIELLPLDHFENLVTFQLPITDPIINTLSEENFEISATDFTEGEVSDSPTENEDSMTSYFTLFSDASKDPSKKKYYNEPFFKRSAKDMQASYSEFFSEIDTKDKIIRNENSDQGAQPSELSTFSDSKLRRGSGETINSTVISTTSTATDYSSNFACQSISCKTFPGRRDGIRSAIKARRNNSCKMYHSGDGNYNYVFNRSAISALLMPNIGSTNFSKKNLSVYKDFVSESHTPEMFLSFARTTISVYPFEKIAYPDYIGACSVPRPEPLKTIKTLNSKLNLLDDIDRQLNNEKLINVTAFDIDQKISQEPNIGKPTVWKNIKNEDVEKLTFSDYKSNKNCLRFCSQFESGNLRKAIQVREYEYDLLLNSDINVNNHHQWFYFEVSNMKAGVAYKFNIINCEKFNSQFNAGMKPVLFSVKEALAGRPYWFRAGKNICYYKNCYTRSQNRSYFTASFRITFWHSDDICYMAYHFPYTYSTLKTHLTHWETKSIASNVYFRCQELCETLSGNSVPIVTITGPDQQDNASEPVPDPNGRSYVFLSARVHPGESNSSWVMKGIIDFLISDKPSAQKLLKNHIFKIIPMLNPDGVINGCHRCSLSGNDLNRRWFDPCPTIHPVIYQAKSLLLYMKRINKSPAIYCDLHGHSQKKNIFMYGCSALKSWLGSDSDNPTYHQWGEDISYQILPYILNQNSPAFSLQDSHFHVEEIKETSARVVVWRQMGIINSYCMESTFCGFDQGIYRNTQVSTHHLLEMGHQFCEGIMLLNQVPPAERDMFCLPSCPNRCQTNSQENADNSTSDSLVTVGQSIQKAAGLQNLKVGPARNKDSDEDYDDEDIEEEVEEDVDDEKEDEDDEKEDEDDDDDDEDDDDDDDDDDNINRHGEHDVNNSCDDACEVVPFVSNA
ncbi:cytosolic carboxypeptidase 1-like isoform X2 [Argonauta hians]